MPLPHKATPPSSPNNDDFSGIAEPVQQDDFADIVEKPAGQDKPSTWQDKADAKITEFSRPRTSAEIHAQTSKSLVKMPEWSNQVEQTFQNVGRRALGGLAETAIHPLNTIKGMYDMGKELVTAPIPIPGEAGEKAARKWDAANQNSPIHRQIKDFQDTYARSPREAIENLSGDLLAMYATGKMLDAAGKPLKPIAEGIKKYARENIAPTIINHTIKPLASDLKFGKDPAQALLEEKIVGNDLHQLSERTYAKLQEVGKELSAQAKLPANASKIVDVSDSIKPIDEAIKEANGQGKTSLVKQLSDLRKELTWDYKAHVDAKGNVSSRPVRLKSLKMSPEEALEFKRNVASRIKWDGNEPFNNELNGVRGEVFGKLKDSVNNAVPGLKDLNQRYSNLIGAAKAIERRAPIADRNAFLSLSDIALGTHNPVLAVTRKVVGLPMVTTRVAKALYGTGKSTPSVPTILPTIKSTTAGAAGVMANRPEPNKESNPPDDEKSSVATPKELRDRAKHLNPAAQGQVAYNHTAVNPATGHRIGSRNGVDWEDIQTGARVA